MQWWMSQETSQQTAFPLSVCVYTQKPHESQAKAALMFGYREYGHVQQMLVVTEN